LTKFELYCDGRVEDHSAEILFLKDKIIRRAGCAACSRMAQVRPTP